MAWIRKIEYKEAEGKLKKLYNKIIGPGDYIDNIKLVHGLRPHTLEGHMSLYKNVLHHTENTLPSWLLEAIGIYVSLLNNCDYCIKHHSAGLARLIDAESAQRIMQALEEDSPDQYFGGKELAIMDYVRKLTLTPDEIIRNDVSLLQVTDIPDEEILEINQAVAYFAYANRVVLGLGVDTEGEIMGLSPGRKADDDWTHE